MPYENDVFVSYAHIDDQVLADGQVGWISALHRALEVRLAQLIGKEARIWRDPKLHGNDVFADTLVERLPNVAVLVSVLSPRYVKSEWCQRELQEFLSAAGGGRLADKLRVFKVVKTPVPREEFPAPLQPVLGYEFYTVESQSGRPRELGPNAAPDARQLYWDKLEDLAHDIADLLQLLEGRETPNDGGPKGTVYLAEAGADLKERRDAIKRELQGHGYTVLPDQALPIVADECAARIREQLERSQLSIHMVGHSYGFVPDGATESIVTLQHELAVARAARGDFCRLIWMPPDLAVDDPRQQAFIELLQSDVRTDGHTDLLKTPLEDFKSVLHVRLNPPKPAEPTTSGTPAASATARRIYLICDQRDVDAARPVGDHLFDAGFEVLPSCFDGDEAQIREYHDESLKTCDAVLIYHGSANELWLRGKLREIQKAAGYGRETPLMSTAIYMAPPGSPEKQRFRTHDALVLAAIDTTTAEALSPFVVKLT